MDAIVQQALAKWPNVPAVYGWLALDRRGRWLIKGERISNETVIAFIGRNYDSDDKGRWFFQNGPQRVFVAMEYTPWVYSLEPSVGGAALTTHTGIEITRINGAWIDNEGSMLIESELGVGVINDHDLPALTDRLHDEAGNRLSEESLLHWLKRGSGSVYLHWAGDRIPMEIVDAARVAARFAFNPNPRPAPGEPEC